MSGESRTDLLIQRINDMSRLIPKELLRIEHMYFVEFDYPFNHDWRICFIGITPIELLKVLPSDNTIHKRIYHVREDGLVETILDRYNDLKIYSEIESFDFMMKHYIHKDSE